MRRALAVLCFLSLVVPIAVVQAKKGDEPVQPPTADGGVGTIVTILDPLVEFPWVVISLNFSKEAGGTMKHAVTSEVSPLDYLGSQGRSVRVHLQLVAEGIDLEKALEGLVNHIDGANLRHEEATLDMAWGRSGTWTGTLSAAAGSQGDVHGESFGQSSRAHFNFTLVDAEPTNDPPRDFRFNEPGLDLAVYVLDFEFEKTIPWGHAPNSSGDSPELEFTSPDARSLTLELMFDTYEEKKSVREPVENLSKLSWGLPRTPPEEQIGMDWGNNTFRGMLMALEVQYTMFLPDATPVRAHVTLHLEGVHKSKWQHLPDVRSGEVVLWDHGFEVPSTLLALNLWLNATNESGAEQVVWHKHANFDTKPFKFPQEPVNFSGRFFFDGFETKTNVSKMLEPLVNLTGSSDEDRRPTRVKVVWGGALPAFEGVLESISTKYTMFLPDGTPVRATTNITMREAERASFRADAKGSDQNGTKARAEGTTESDTNLVNVTNITFRGPFLGDAAPLLDWALAVATGQGTAMTMRFSFDAPVPTVGQWRCTALTFTPPQFAPAGVQQARITVRAEVLGLKANEQPAFEPEMARQRCVIDADNADAAGAGSRHVGPDEFAKATGFNVEIDGVQMTPIGFEGLRAVIPLAPDSDKEGHHSLGTAEWEELTLTGQLTGDRSDLMEWYNRSTQKEGGERRDVSVSFTNAAGSVEIRLVLRGARPVSYHFDGKGEDVDVEEIELCVEKVERA